MKNAERLAHRPFRVVGASGKKYGIALPDPEHGNFHVVEFTLEELLEIGKDLALGAVNPFCRWHVADVKVDPDELNEAKLAEELEKAMSANAELRLELEKLAKQLGEANAARDAAIRAIGSGSAPAPADPLSAPTPAVSAAAPVSVQKNGATPPAPAPAGGKPVWKTLEQLKKFGFRDLRAHAIKMKVPNAEKLEDKVVITEAYMAFAALNPNGPPADETPAPAKDGEQVNVAADEADPAPDTQASEQQP